MAIHSPEIFNQSLPAQHDGVFEWDFLDKCFPRRIKPCDVDAQVEVNGYFLKFETKGSGDPLLTIQPPQRSVIIREAELLGPRVTWLLIEGKTAETIGRIAMLRYYCGPWLVRTHSGVDALEELCRQWAIRADAQEHINAADLSGWKPGTLPGDWRKYSLRGADTWKTPRGHPKPIHKPNASEAEECGKWFEANMKGK